MKTLNELVREALQGIETGNEQLGINEEQWAYLSYDLEKVLTSIAKSSIEAVRVGEVT